MEVFWKLIDRIALFFLRLLFRILHRELTEGVQEAFLQFVKFGVIGVTNTVISYGTYTLALLGLRAGGASSAYDYLIAQVVGFVISVAWSFYWNNKYVFTKGEGENRSWVRALLKTYVSYSFTGLFLNSLLLILWVDLLGISEFIAPIINLVVSVPLNFIINKFWAFRTKKEEK